MSRIDIRASESSHITCWNISRTEMVAEDIGGSGSTDEGLGGDGSGATGSLTGCARGSAKSLSDGLAKAAFSSSEDVAVASSANASGGASLASSPDLTCSSAASRVATRNPYSSWLQELAEK